MTIRRRLACAITSAAAALAGSALLIQPGGTPAAGAQPCPDIEVVFARGTGEPAGVGLVGQSFVDSLRSQVAPQSVGVYAVNYPASITMIGSGGGANDVNAHVQQMANACPNTKIVLGGYSQGAAVIDFVGGVPVAGFSLGNPLPPHLLGNIAAVAVFGNPAMKLEGPLSALSPTLGYKTIDLCNPGDPICSDGRDRSAHSEYATNGATGQAAGFVARLV